MQLPIIIFCISILPFLFPACAKKKVAEVGSIPITAKDISFRAKVSDIYYPGSGKDYIGLTQLIKGYLSEEVLKSLGQKVDQSAWETEAQRIDANTKAPAVLEKVKRVYGRDRKDFLNSFIRVVYAERVLYNEIFLKSAAIHREQREKAEEFLKAASHSPAKFSEVAKARGLDAKKFRLSAEGGIQPLETRRTPAGPRPVGFGQEQAQRLIAAVASLKPGAVAPDLIEWQEGFQALRFLKKEGKDYLVESVSVPKRGFDEWFWERASQIPVRIYNQELKDELVKNVGWAKNLKLE